MKKYLTILFFTLSLFNLYGQNKGSQNLITVIDTIKVIDTVRVKNDETILKNETDVKNSVANVVDINSLISLFALIVSAISLLVSYFTYRIQRKHNINSLKPFIIIHPYDYEDHIKIEIKNQGTGVAIITNLTVSNNVESKLNLFKWLPEKLPKGLNYEDYFLGGLGEFAISPNNVINFLEIKFDKTKNEQIEIRNQIRQTLSTLIIEIVYKDVYENIFRFERDLLFFGRTDNENSDVELMIKAELNVEKKVSS